MKLSTAFSVLAAAAIARAALPATPSGWTLLFSDDFTGAANTGVDTSRWIYDIGTQYEGGPANWGTGEIQSYTSSTANVYQDGSGNLIIRAIRSGTAWTSGRIQTVRTNFMPPSGGTLIVEGRIQLPALSGAAAQGYWPAFWMLGAAYRGNYQNWPGVGEIDILEAVNGVNTVYGTLHCDVNPGGECNETTGKGGSTPLSIWGSWHTYKVEWDASQIRWYADGVNFFTIQSSQLTAATWAAVTNHGYFILLNLAIGGSFPGAPGPSIASGGAMLVDYIAVWSRGGTTTPSPTTSSSPASTGTSCTGTRTCGSANYDCSQYVCLTGNQLCPLSAPNACGTACYSSSLYKCCSGNVLRQLSQAC